VSFREYGGGGHSVWVILECVGATDECFWGNLRALLRDLREFSNDLCDLRDCEVRRRSNAGWASEWV